jgi:hypothetical protein
LELIQWDIIAFGGMVRAGNGNLLSKCGILKQSVLHFACENHLPEMQSEEQEALFVEGTVNRHAPPGCIKPILSVGEWD